MAAEQTSPEMRTYRGNCHCGAFVYEATVPEITQASECDCSMCVKKGYLFVFTNSAKNFKVVKGSQDDLVTYRFGGKNLDHKFCPICATGVVVTCPVGAPPDKDIGLNVHAIQGINTWELKRTLVKGSELGKPYEAAVFKGSQPAAIEGGKLYTGSCHCGRVTVALINKPLEDDEDSGMIECNCSICERIGALWVYPKKEQVVLFGDEADIGRYIFSNRIIAKTFCKHCGVVMTNAHNPLPAEEYAALSERVRKTEANHRYIHPVNTRVLTDVDVKRLRWGRLDGATMIHGPYVNP